jgi:murein DD-endopeptidase MepM/ murein hydrolase activator NlpD
MMAIRTLGKLLALAALLPGFMPTPASAQRAPVIQSLDVRVPWQPSPIKTGEQWRLVYELHLDNYSADLQRLQRLRIIDTGSGRTLGEYEGAALRSLLSHPGKASQADDALTIAPGTHAVVYVDLPLADAPSIDLRLVHELAIDAPDKPAFNVRGAMVAVQGGMTPIVFSPPLRDGYWVAVYDASWPRGHRRSLYAVNGALHVPGRFAIDWIKVDMTGHYTNGDATVPANWLGYGEDVLAVADGTVAAAEDGMPEPEKVDPGKPTKVPLQDASGNYVNLDLGGGRYVFYEHLKTGSITVKAGQKVRRGDVIGRLGYSGETTGPHLHMHVADANAPLDAEGIPYALDAFGWMGSYGTIDDFAKEKPWWPSAQILHRQGELPGPLSVVTFAPKFTGFFYELKRAPKDRD